MLSKKLLIWSGVAILAVAGGWKLNQIRHEVGGLRNMLSITYWKAHLNHTDLYAPNAKMLKHGNREHKEVALTIDDGPHPVSCAQILDILKNNGIHATFFPVGMRVKQHPELVKRMVAEGHEVGNHTEDHLRLTTLRPDQVKSQLQFAETNFFRATGRKMYLMRPPGMNWNAQVIDIIKGMGYTTVGWTTAAKDFVGGLDHKTEVPPDVVAERAMRDIDSGGIILLHDAPDTAQALPIIIDKLTKEGYSFVTIPQMMAHLPEPVYVKSNAGPYRTAAK